MKFVYTIELYYNIEYKAIINKYRNVIKLINMFNYLHIEWILRKKCTFSSDSDPQYEHQLKLSLYSHVYRKLKNAYYTLFRSSYRMLNWLSRVQ